MNQAVIRGSRRLADVLTIAACVSIAAAVFSLAARYHWTAEVAANLRVQQVMVTPLIVAILAWQRRWGLGAACLVAALCNTTFLANAWPRARFSQAGTPVLVVTTSNVLTSNRRHGDVISDVLSGDPDVFALLEGGTELSKKVAEHTDHLYPYRIVRPQDVGNFGIAFFSKHPIVDEEVFTLDNHNIESIAATIEVNSNRYRFYVTHPLPPVSTRNFQSRNAHLSGLADRIAADRRASPDLPVVLMGDLNLTPWSPFFGDLVAMTRLRRAIAGPDITPTHYSGPPLLPFGLVIDHVLISSTLDCRSHTVGPSTGSDHRSVTVELSRTR